VLIYGGFPLSAKHVLDAVASQVDEPDAVTSLLEPDVVTSVEEVDAVNR